MKARRAVWTWVLLTAMTAMTAAVPVVTVMTATVEKPIGAIRWPIGRFSRASWATRRRCNAAAASASFWRSAGTSDATWACNVDAALTSRVMTSTACAAWLSSVLAASQARVASLQRW